MNTGRKAALLLLCLAGGAAAGPGTDELRRKTRPSVTELSKRLVEYGRKGDLERVRKVHRILEPFLCALDAKWKTGIAPSLEKALATKDAKAAALQGLRSLYWDLFDLLDRVRAAAEPKPKALRSRILKARADYELLAPLVHARKAKLRLHRGILKGFLAMVRAIPGGHAYGVSKDWRKKTAATAGTVLKLVAAALPQLHGRPEAK